MAAIIDWPITKGRPMVHGDSVWVPLASTTTAKPETKYQAPASATVRGSERTEAKMPSDTRICHSPGRSHSVLGRKLPHHHGEQNAGNACGEELLDRLVDHGVGETRMMAARARAHLDPDDQAAECSGNEPAEKEAERLARGIAEQPELQHRGHERDRAGRGHGRRAVAAERGAGRDLAADRHDVGQCLVEIAHLQTL